MFNSEFDERFAGRYFGKYRGFVVDVDDEKELIRVKVKCPVVMGSEEELGWALPSLSAGGHSNAGDVFIPQINDFVWLEFEAGDTAYPVWSPGPWAFRNGESMAPRHGRGQPDYTDYSVREIDNIPPTQFEGDGKNVRIIQGPDGSFLEFDGTPGSERVQLSHYTGSRYEISADGGMQEVCIGSQRRFINGMHSIKSLAEEREVQGERTVSFGGLATETYAANVTRTYNTVAESGESFRAVWAGDCTMKAGSLMDLVSAGNAALSTSGQLAFMVGSNLQASVMETIDFTASNTTYGEVPPLAPTPVPSIKIHGYNGSVSIRAADSTGKLKEAVLELNPTILGVGSSTWKCTTVNSTVVGGQIELVETPSLPAVGPANVFLGAGVTTEPLVKGTTLVTLLTQLFAALSAHTHEVAGVKALASVDLTTAVNTLLKPHLDTPGKLTSTIVETS